MLRNLIMALLLANLLLLAWGRWIVAPDVDDPQVYGDSSAPRLVLIDQPRRPDGAGGASARDGQRCFRLGPFSNANAAAVVGVRLSARGMPVERTREAGQIWVGHWVQLLGLASSEAASRAVAALVRGGISDAYISAREPTVDISLGVFRSQRGADDRILLARNIGYEAVATDRYRDGVEHWVEVSTQADQPLDLDDLRVAGAARGQAQIVRIEERACGLAAAVNESNGSGDGDSLEFGARETGLAESQTLPE